MADGWSSGHPLLTSGPGLTLHSDLPTDAFLRLVEYADAAGYSELWYSDIRFLRDPFVELGLAASHSQRLLLGTQVSDPYSRHPALIAMAYATLDEASGGRAQIGLGSGAGAVGGFAEMGINRQRPLRGLREGIEIVRATLSGGVVRYHGELFQLDGAVLGFKPARPSIPIFVASEGEQALRLCGRYADGVLLANYASGPAIQDRIEHVRAGERAAARPAGSVRIHLRLETCVAGDEGAALAVLKHRFANRLAWRYPEWSHLPILGFEPGEALRRAAEQALASQASFAPEGWAASAYGHHPMALEPLIELIPDDVVRGTALVGTVDRVAAQLVEILTPAVSRVTIRPYGHPGQPPETTAHAFIEEVWPKVLRQLEVRVPAT